MKESWKRKWLDKLSTKELEVMTEVEKKALAYKRGHHIKKHLQAKERARQRALTVTGSSFGEGIIPFYLSPLFFCFRICHCFSITMYGFVVGLAEEPLDLESSNYSPSSSFDDIISPLKDYEHLILLYYD